jgi:hypothetical protein
MSGTEKFGMQFYNGHKNPHGLEVAVGKSQFSDTLGACHFKILGIVPMVYHVHLVCFGIAYPNLGFCYVHIGFFFC